MIDVDIKSKIYKMKNGNKYKALDNVKFSLNDCGIVCILGSSGSGKTTLMNIMGALDLDFDGDVKINNNSLKKFKGNKLDNYRKNTIGFVFQQFYLVNKFSVYDNIELAFDISNQKDKKEKINTLLKSVNMQKYANRKANVLSGGQKQRVAIARALANSPDIILADEPTGALDIKNSEEIMQIFKKLSSDKLIVIITHNDELAHKYADQIIHIEDGKIFKIDDIKKETNKEETENAIDNSINNKKNNMSCHSAFKYSFKTMLNKKGRVIATAIGLAIGIVGIGMALSISNGTMKYAKSQVESIMPTNMVTISGKNDNDNDGNNKLKGIFKKNSKLYTMDDINKIKANDDKIQNFWLIPNFVSKEFFSEVSLSKENAESSDIEESSFIIQNGFEPSENVEDNITYGRICKNENEVVISLNTAQYLTKNEMSDLKKLLNTDIYLKFQDFKDLNKYTIYSFKIVGITNINTTGYSIYQNSNDTLKLYSNIKNININDIKFIKVYAYLDNRLNSNQISKNISDFNSLQTDYLMEGAAKNNLDSMQTFMNVLKNVLFGFSFISIIIAVLMIGITTFISVIEQTSEIGILRAIGAHKRDIRHVFIFETVIVGVLSSIIGILITGILSNILNNSISNILKNYGLKIGLVNIAQLSMINMLEIVVICVILSVIAGIIPANKAAKLDPIVALKRD